MTRKSDALPRAQPQAGRFVTVNLNPGNLLVPFRQDTKMDTSSAYVVLTTVSKSIE